MISRRTSFVIAVVAAATALAGCSRKSCLRGNCEELRACDALDFVCEGPVLYIGTVADAPAELRLLRGEGADDDLMMTNGVVTVVLDSVDAAHDLAPTGGNLLDFGPAGGADDLNLIYQIAGILPDDAFAYERIEVIDEASYVAAVAYGHLDGRPDIEVVTRYELRPCDPGVRMRSELFNGSPDVQAYVLADVPHWGKRRVVPFASRPEQGYLQPELDLLELSSLYDRYTVGAAAATGVDSPGYAVAACNQAGLDGINDLELSALGTPPQLVHPGETVVLERFWAAAGAGAGPAPGIDIALAVRAQLFGDDAQIPIAGTVFADGLPFGGDVRRVSIIISSVDGDIVTPLTAVVPDLDGAFAVGVPDSPGLRWDLSSFGRPVARGDVPEGGQIGDIDIAAPAILQVTVGDGVVGLHAQVVLVPADEGTAAVVRGSFHGRFDECAPWLGPPHGSSPACNRFLVDPDGAQVEVPAGSYDIYATAGPDHTLARQQDVVLDAGATVPLTFTLTPLDVVPAGWLSADLHVHGRASFDSSIPDLDRVQSFVAAGIEVIAATDHDYVTDYAGAVDTLGVGDRVRVMGGIETTQLIPWMKLAGDDFPRVIGHFNFWPITPVPSEPRGGAPWDELIEPGQLFDRMAPHIGDDGVKMLNHPWDESVSGRDLGYLRAIEFDPRQPIPQVPDASRNGALTRLPGSVFRNIDWDVIEVQNGAGIDEFVKARPLWWSLISQGFVSAGVASSDSHGLTDAHLGWGRTLVETGGDLAGFDEVTFDRALKDGKTVGGSGIMLIVEIMDDAGVVQRGLGFTPYQPQSGDQVRIEVRAAPWIPVEEVRVITADGFVTRPVDGAPADPFGSAGVIRDVILLPLANFLDLSRDTWFLVEAGLPLLDYEDFDDDGVPDTGDNDGDGDVDQDDIEDGEDAGPLTDPPDPALDDEDDPRYLMTRVVPRAYPVAFTSPILIDVDGDGWEPPGVSP